MKGQFIEFQLRGGRREYPPWVWNALTHFSNRANLKDDTMRNFRNHLQQESNAVLLTDDSGIIFPSEEQAIMFILKWS